MSDLITITIDQFETIISVADADVTIVDQDDCSPENGSITITQLTLTNDLTQGLSGLPDSDIRFTIAQLSPGANGGSSEWQS